VPGDPATKALRHEVHGRLVPASVTLSAAPGGDESPSPLLSGRLATDASAVAVAYVCERYACRRPVREPEALRSEIDAALAAR
jgi:uncharacterized protein YyaL (SSP411 family)